MSAAELVINGSIVGGVHGAGGEIGHMKYLRQRRRLADVENADAWSSMRQQPVLYV